MIKAETIKASSSRSSVSSKIINVPTIPTYQRATVTTGIAQPCPYNARTHILIVVRVNIISLKRKSIAGFFRTVVAPICQALISSGHGIRRNIKRTPITPRKGTFRHSYQTLCPSPLTAESSVNCQSRNQDVAREPCRRDRTLHVSKPFPRARQLGSPVVSR